MKPLLLATLLVLPLAAQPQTININQLRPGTNGQCVTTSGGVSTWATCPGGISSLAVGTTPVTAGTTTRVLFDNAGVLGEYTISGSGTTIAMTTNPTFIGPALGTPASGVMTNVTGLPVSTGISGLGTGVATALGIAVSGSGAICLATGSVCGAISGLTTSALVTAASASTIQTPSATATMDASGNISTPGTITTSGAGSGKYTFNGGTSGSAAITVAAVAGTPADIQLPTATGSAGTCLQTNGATPQSTTWATCGGTAALSGITAAAGANTIANADNAQVWNWATTTSGRVAMIFGEGTASVSAGTPYILQAKTLIGSTATPFNVFNSLNGSQTLPAVSITPTWNTTGVVDAALLINVTNTASGAASKLFDAQVGGTSQANIDKSGNVIALGALSLGASPPNYTTGSGASFGLTEGTASTGLASNDVCWADSTAHGLKCSLNNGSAVNVLTSAGLAAIATGKTLTASNSITLAGTDATVMTFPTTTATIARTDAGQTFTGVQVMASPTFTGTVGGASATWTAANSAASYATATNCADSAGAAACGSAAAGAFVTDVAATSTVVSTTAVTANSEIFVFFDSSLGTRLGITCNTTPATVAVPTISARTAGTSFTLSISGTVGTNPACWNYYIVN